MVGGIHMWEQPPVIGYKVILNPEGENYHCYRGQSKDGAGWIIINELNESELKEWSHIGKRERLNVLVNVLWENGHRNIYRLSDLLPIENGFRDVEAVLFDNGDEVRDFAENIEEIIDYKVIVKERRVVNRYRYGQKYRDKFLNQDKSTE